MAKFLPHIERLESISLRADLVAVAGRRDAKGATSSVHIAKLPKLDASVSVEIGPAVFALCFVGDLLCVGDKDGNLHVIDCSDKIAGISFVDKKRHKGAIRAVMAVGELIASVGDDGTLVLSELSVSKVGGRKKQVLSQRALRTLAVDSEGVLLAAAGDDGIVRSLLVADVGLVSKAGATRAAVREMPMGHGVGALCFLGDGRIAAGCADGGLRMVYLEGDAAVDDRAKTAAHASPVRSLLYSPELSDKAKRPLPRRLISISEDGTAKAWQVDTRRKPPTTIISKSALTAAVLVPANERAKANRRGGTLIVVDKGRCVTLVEVDEEGKLSEDSNVVRSQLEEIQEHLKSRKDDVRVKACAALTLLPEDEARRLLDGVLSDDGSATVRRAAASGIASSDRRLSRPALRAALNDYDKRVRESALASLEKIERDTPIAAARAALDSKKSDIRAAGVKKLPSLREFSPLVPTLIAGALSDSEAVVRDAALDALYLLEAKQPLQAARIALGRGPASIRGEVLLRIGRTRMALTGDGSELIEDALDDTDESVRSIAFLTAIASRSALIAKVRAVDSHTQKAIAELERHGSFAEIGQASSISEADLRPLFAAMACRYADTAIRAARLLALLGDPRATGALLQLSREPDATLRLHVVEALMSASMAMPGDARVLDRLRWMIDDSEQTVRHSAFDVLQMFAEGNGASGQIELAALALRASQEDIRVRSLPVLVKFGGSGQFAGMKDLSERADMLLGDALDDEHDKVRAEAFRTLWAWHSKNPRKVLARASRCRQPEVRRRVVKELPNQKPASNAWADELLLQLVSDVNERVGVDAFEAVAKPKSGKSRVELYVRALNSTCVAVQLLGLKGAPKAGATELVPLVVKHIEDDTPKVYIAAIEALDRLDAKHANGFALAFGSIFYGLRVRAMELCARRRDARCETPIREFLAVPEVDRNRPDEELRARAASAIADLGSNELLGYYTSLLSDPNGGVREMAARGLATACQPGDESMLVAGLNHEDLAVRSWLAEGLSRLGDVRALPVLSGTLSHDHLPLRRGAIMGFVALGPDGVRGILKGLEDNKREIQDLVFAVIVARDLALSSADEAPDLLLSALCAMQPEIRYAAARVLEIRGSADHKKLAADLIGPRRGEKASDRKDWPSENDQETRLQVLVDALASDDPVQRYAATQVLSLRGQALAFWREAKTLLGPASAVRPRIPFTNWDRESQPARKVGWIRSLFASKSSGKSTATSETGRLLELLGTVPAADGVSAPLEEAKLVFGTYAGLVRQTGAGNSDETHRVRRDAVARLAVIAGDALVGRDAVLPVLQRALGDPHHMVRRSAVTAVRSLYPDGSLEPLRLELSCSAADVGRGAVNELVAKSEESAEALELAKSSINAPVSDVRRYGLSQLPQLYPSGSLDPWLLALDSRYSDIRLNVVDRLFNSSDNRVMGALSRAMESEHEDLRLRAAQALAQRGDIRTVDVLGALLYSDDYQEDACEALVELCDFGKNEAAHSAAALAIVNRLENDPDETAERYELFDALEDIASPVVVEFLVDLVLSEDLEDNREWLLQIAAKSLSDREAKIVYDEEGETVVQFQDVELAVSHATRLISSKDPGIRCVTINTLLRFIPGRDAEEVLEGLLQDRELQVRVAACLVLAYRAQQMEDASVGALASALREGRRELVLPAAEGLAARQDPQAFQALLLVFKAGEQEERQRAIRAMGSLGDSRALEELEGLVETANELEPEDAEMIPVIVEAMGRMLPHLDDEASIRVRARVENLAREGSQILRERAFTGLRYAGDDASRVFLEGIAADKLETYDIRNAAIHELGRLGSEKSESVLADIIKMGDYSVGSTALEALQRIFPGQETRTKLLALSSSDSYISAPAAVFLSWFGDVDTLVNQLGSVSNLSLRANLRQGLIRRGACPVDKLKEMLLSSDVGDRCDASWIVGAAEAKSLSAELESALGKAAKAYADAKKKFAGQNDKLGAQRIKRALEAWTAGLWAAQRVQANVSKVAIAAIDNTDLPEYLRSSAVQYISELGNDKEVKGLEPLLSDSQPGVRSAASAGLAARLPKLSEKLLGGVVVGDNAALRPIVQAALKSGADMLKEESSRLAAVGTMIGEKRVTEFGKAAKKSGSDPSRLAAIAALGRVGGSEAEGVLSTLLENKKEIDAVRAATYRALRSLQRRAAKAAIWEERS